LQSRSSHTPGNSDRERIHTDDSIQVKYYDDPDAKISKAAFTFAFRAGCKYGGDVSCGGAARRTRRHNLFSDSWPTTVRGCPDGRRWRDQQSWTLSCVNPTNQWRDGDSRGRPLSPRIRAIPTEPGTPRWLSTSCRASS